MRQIIDLTGQKFNRLTVIERAENRKNITMWLCRCECGKLTVVAGAKLKNGHTKSCGCLNQQLMSERRTKHNGRHTRLYAIWRAIKQRCENENNIAYKYYGGRGITICKEWQNDFEVFRDWAISNGYADSLSIDRIDTDGNYTPQNCRWATNKEQANNKRNNHLLTHNGKTQTLKEWAEETGLNYSTLRSRINRDGLSVSDAITKGA